MKITQELIDNGQKIVHLNYEKSDIEKLKKMHKEQMAKLKEKQESNLPLQKVEEKENA